MANLKKGKYIIDARGNKTAVVLDIKEYNKIMELLEDADDIKYVKEHLVEETVPYEKVRKKLIER